MAVESLPPLVPEGERFENVEALLANISGRSLVTSMVFSPQGDTLASGSQDGTVRLWDVASGRELRRLEGHRDAVRAVNFSPQGNTLASGSQDGTVRLYIQKTAQPIWIFSGGQRGMWLTCNVYQQCWRYDDGTLLQRQDAQGTFTPLVPPAPAAKGALEIQARSASLVTADGGVTPFSLTLRNSGGGRVYWVNVVQDIPPGQTRGMMLHPPPTLGIVEPGATVELPCQISTPAERTNPQSYQVMLHLRITTAHDASLPVEPILVTTHTPSLQWLQAR